MILFWCRAVVLIAVVFDTPGFPESRIPGELEAHGALSGTTNSVGRGGRRSARDEQKQVGLVIVCCYRVTKMTGIRGAWVEKPGSSAKYVGVPRARMENIPGSAHNIYL